MNITPTTGELKVKMDEMCEDIADLKQSIKDGFADLKKDLASNYVRIETLKLTLEPLQEFKKTATGVGYTFVVAILLGILGLLLTHVIPGFEI